MKNKLSIILYPTFLLQSGPQSNMKEPLLEVIVKVLLSVCRSLLISSGTCPLLTASTTNNRIDTNKPSTEELKKAIFPEAGCLQNEEDEGRSSLVTTPTNENVVQRACAYAETDHLAGRQIAKA